LLTAHKGYSEAIALSGPPGMTFISEYLWSIYTYLEAVSLLWIFVGFSLIAIRGMKSPMFPWHLRSEEKEYQDVPA
jgi:hypothetical protein